MEFGDQPECFTALQKGGAIMNLLLLLLMIEHIYLQLNIEVWQCKDERNLYYICLFMIANGKNLALCRF